MSHDDAIRERSQVAERIHHILPPDAALRCPCLCVAPEVAVAGFDDGDVRYCMPCLQAGYTCRLEAA